MQTLLACCLDVSSLWQRTCLSRVGCQCVRSKLHMQVKHVKSFCCEASQGKSPVFSSEPLGAAVSTHYKSSGLKTFCKCQAKLTRHDIMSLLQ